MAGDFEVEEVAAGDFGAVDDEEEVSAAAAGEDATVDFIPIINKKKVSNSHCVSLFQQQTPNEFLDGANTKYMWLPCLWSRRRSCAPRLHHGLVCIGGGSGRRLKATSLKSNEIICVVRQ